MDLKEPLINKQAKGPLKAEDPTYDRHDPKHYEQDVSKEVAEML